MPVAIFFTAISAPGTAPPEASVTVPESVAPVTCEYIEIVKNKLKTTRVSDARIFVSFRGFKPLIEFLLKDDAAIAALNFVFLRRYSVDKCIVPTSHIP